MSHRILLLAALPEEADAFCPGEGAVIDGGPMPLRQIELAGAHVTIATCGLGKVNAAFAVGCHVTPDTALVAMTGTCGKIGPVEGDCFWIARAIQHDYGARQAAGFVHYRAGDWPMGEARDHGFAAMPDPGLGLPHAAIASGDTFLECPETAEALAERLGTHLVDMEVAAVAQAAEALGLPWCAIKAVTDDADGESAGDFSANLRRAARKAGAAMERLIASVA
ncbi:MAG: purine phosphorylase [Sphingomonadales bacterium]|nr:purine phosphorylase [Sphingomonadales bacterium]MBK9005117.1 purine phosphorylase [Sphingomonadales bacterium]MBK9267150.1 purine phosphorylase [Sphingomonadales bacterium]MBP6433045.1 purine phosphorylase [Sphingorhabdus sp.]